MSSHTKVDERENEAKEREKKKQRDKIFDKIFKYFIKVEIFKMGICGNPRKLESKFLVVEHPFNFF